MKYVDSDIDESSEKEENNIENFIEFKNTGGYEFWFNLNNEQIKISTYAEAMDLHLKLLKTGDYKMSEFFLQLSKK